MHYIDLSIFARGGGGGSGGGGGGGSGGSIILLLGYVPAHYIGAFLRKKMQNPVGLVLMIILTIIYGAVWWFAGSFGVFVSIAAFFGGPAGYFNWVGKISGRTKKKAAMQLATAAQDDPAWDPAALDARIQNVFYNFQTDWSNMNVANFKNYMTPNYEYHNQLMMSALRLRGRQNLVENPKLLAAFPTSVTNMPDNSQDSVIFYIDAKADDRLIETVDGQQKQLFIDKRDFFEYWRFQRINNQWMLANISQITQNPLMVKTDIQVFAVNNNMCYSPDWGWLLLPSRGQLFKGGKFGKSDINNHVIGVYNKILVEMYTYVPVLSQNSTNSSQYVIAQVALPKRYDSLIVDAKNPGLGGLFSRTPKGYNKISLEWPDFNKRYNVYATNVEQVTVFELLHPVYMEKLFALPFRVSIEVVDNVVYLYSKDKKADYPTMYSILQDAFKEMRM